MADCLFCRITDGTVPSRKVYEDDLVLAFHDIDPKAPVHVLIIPKVHLGSVLEINPQHSSYLMAMCQAAREIAEMMELEDGFRLVVNTGADGGQTVDHLHMHLLGGRRMAWPPG
jgi:histidine triad (HIT) family protein